MCVCVGGAKVRDRCVDVGVIGVGLNIKVCEFLSLSVHQKKKKKKQEPSANTD